MKICFLSDTHGDHKGLKNLPEADVICHTGDYSPRGTHADLNEFLRWFGALDQYKYKIFTFLRIDFIIRNNDKIQS